MASKFTTVITANTTQHDNALKKSAQEVYKYQKRVDTTKKGIAEFGNTLNNGISSITGFNLGIGKITGGFGKMNPYLLAGSAAIGGFCTIIKNNEVLLDNFQGSIDSIKNSFRELTQDLSSGDLGAAISNFFSGLSLGRDLYNAEDARDTYFAFDEPAVMDARNRFSETRNAVIEAQINGDREALDEAKRKNKESTDEYIRLLNGELKKINDAKLKSLFAAIHPTDLLSKSDIIRFAEEYFSSGEDWDRMVSRYESDRAKGLKNNSTALMNFMHQALASEKELRDSEKGYLSYLIKEKSLHEQINDINSQRLRIEKTKVSTPTIKATKATKITEEVIEEPETIEDTRDILGDLRQRLEELKKEAVDIAFVIEQIEFPDLENSENPEVDKLEYLSAMEEYSFRKIDLDDVLEEIKSVQREINKYEALINNAINEVENETENNISVSSLTYLENQLKELKKQLQLYIDIDNVEGVKRTLKYIKYYEDEAKEKKISLGLIEPDKIEEIKVSFQETYSAINSLYSSIASLGSLLGKTFDNEDIEEFFDSIQNGLNVVNALYSVFESFNKVLEIFNALKSVNNQLTKEGTVAATADAVAEGADTSAKAGNAIAGATAAGASIPFPYNLIAIAGGIAAVVGALALIGNYAQGGIIGGSTTVGDHQLAHVNAGEMILNQREQTRLWHMVNGIGVNNGNGVNGSVSFRISGSDLVGVLNNYETKNRRIK